MKNYDLDELMELTEVELEACSGGKLCDNQCQDVMQAMVQAHLKAQRMRDSGKDEEALVYIRQVTNLYKEFGGLFPKPEYEGVYFSELIDLS
ncbi:MAG: hypothetical protein IKP14_04025 [Clostridiales bacterium]|nr:hypothetical protein [Clostridiales bacterium]